MTWLTLIAGMAFGAALGFLLAKFLDSVKIRAAEKEKRDALYKAELAEADAALYKDRAESAEKQIFNLRAAQGKEDEIKNLEGDRLSAGLDAMLNGVRDKTDADNSE